MQTSSRSHSKNVPYRRRNQRRMSQEPDQGCVVFLGEKTKQKARSLMTGEIPSPPTASIVSKSNSKTTMTPYRLAECISQEEKVLHPRQYIRRLSEEVVKIHKQYIRRLSEDFMHAPRDLIRLSEEIKDIPTQCARRLSEEITEVVSASETGMMRFWDKLPNWLFPFQCNSLEAFVSLNFCYSIIMTLGTPLNRLIHGQWRGCLMIPRMINSVGKLFFGSTKILQDVYIYYPVEGSTDATVPGSGVPAPPPESYAGMDAGLFLHVACAFLWLVTAWLQMTFFRTYKGGKLHRKFGYVTVSVFAAHMGATVYLLFLDFVVHKTIVKVLLGSTAIISCVHMAQAVFHAVRRGPDWKAMHEGAMIRCFLYSIEGSGPIRVVACLQALFGAGPTPCQDRAGGLATECVKPYIERLMLLRCWTMFVMGSYARMARRREFTAIYLREAAVVIGAASIMQLAYLAETLFDVDLSSVAGPVNTERTYIGNVLVVCSGLGYVAVICGYLLAPFMSHQMQLAEEFDKMWRKSWQERQPSFRHSFVNKPDSAKSLRPSASASAPRANWRTKWATESSLARKAPPPPHSPAPRSTPSLPLSIKRVVSAPLTPGPSPVLDPNSNLKQD